MSETSREFPIRAAPYQHQRKAAAFALNRLESGGGAALLMEMGTGKTLTTIAIVGTLWQEARIQRLLVVAPLSILGVWEDEFERFAAFDYNLAVLSGTGTRKADTIRHMNGAALQVLVVNYESAWRLEKELSAGRPDCIVCDEGHKIKTHNIAASRALHRLGARAQYRLLLTGTVITNKPIDVFSQYKFADPSVYGNSFYLFRNRYFDMVGYSAARWGAERLSRGQIAGIQGYLTQRKISRDGSPAFATEFVAEEFLFAHPARANASAQASPAVAATGSNKEHDSGSTAAAPASMMSESAAAEAIAAEPAPMQAG